MKIFVSHALKDKRLLNDVKINLESVGIKLLIAEHYQDLEHTVSEKIENMIISCDVGLVLLTTAGFNSKFVQQEIGYLKANKKPILQVIQKGLEKRITGFTYGRGFILLDPKFPELAIEKIKNFLLKYWKKLIGKEKEKLLKKRLEQERIKEKQRRLEEQERNVKYVLIGLGILAAILILGSQSS